MHNNFFSMASSKQTVNQWLCIALLALWAFWFMLYYVVNKTYAIGDAYLAGNSPESIGLE